MCDFIRCLHNLLNVLVNIANKVGLQEKKLNIGKLVVATLLKMVSATTFSDTVVIGTVRGNSICLSRNMRFDLEVVRHKIVQVIKRVLQSEQTFMRHCNVL
jgi:hypothetical protein